MNPQTPQSNRPFIDQPRPAAPPQPIPPQPQQPVAPTVSAAPPQAVVMKKSGKMKKFFLWLFVLLLIAAAAGGAYFWQQQKVSDLQTQVNSLQADLSKAKASAIKDDSRASDAGIFGGTQEKARNTERQIDIQALRTQLEAFYSQNAYFPSLTDLNTPAWRTTNMKTLDSTALADPSAPTTTNPQLVAAPAAKAYAYAVTDSAGASCEADDKKCAKYTLTATFEGTVDGAKTYSKSNLN